MQLLTYHLDVLDVYSEVDTVSICNPNQKFLSLDCMSELWQWNQKSDFTKQEIQSVQVRLITHVS